MKGLAPIRKFKKINRTIVIGILVLFVVIGIIALKKNEKPNTEIASERNENLDKYTCEFVNNVDWTRCTIKVLDRASAEREWKQRKLEEIKSTQVNEENMIPELVDEQNKIRKWRLGFETGRDSWCESEMSFEASSGTPGAIADCKLGFELKAITILNDLHYGTIITDDRGAGIPDFEPTDSDLDTLVKTNKTSAGCGWSGEDACE